MNEQRDDHSGSALSSGGDNKFHYCVLYVRISKQHKVANVIRETLPEGRGLIFYPCTELWWHGRDDTVIRPLFPGYLFIRSDMNAGELHDLIRKSRREELSFIRMRTVFRDRRWRSNASAKRITSYLSKTRQRALVHAAFLH